LAEKDTERRRRILHAAEKCFLAQGFHAATTDMIQEAAGVSKSTLYRYFRSKDLLFEATVEAGGQTFLDQLGKVRQKAGDPSGFLNELGRQLLAALLSERALSLVRLMIHESNRFPGVVRRFYMSGPKGVLDIVERFMSEAHARGELRVENPSRAAEQFMGMIRCLSPLELCHCVFEGGA